MEPDTSGGKLTLSPRKIRKCHGGLIYCNWHSEHPYLLSAVGHRDGGDSVAVGVWPDGHAQSPHSVELRRDREAYILVSSGTGQEGQDVWLPTGSIRLDHEAVQPGL